MRIVKAWLATIAVLLCSISANAETSTYYDDWESGNKGEQGYSDGPIFSITANPGETPTSDSSLSSESSYNSISVVASGTCGTNLTWELTNEGELTIEGTGEMENYESSSKYPWYSCQSAIKSVIINEGVTTVGDYAFPIYTNLINLSLPNTIKIIGKNAFDTCEKLTSLIIPEGCTTIGYGAFLYCSGLNTITLPNSLTSIGDYAFASCWNIESLIIPEKVEFIGELAFRATTRLNTIRVDSNNTTFDSRNDCNAIIETNTNKLRLGCSSTIIPNDIVIIGEGAFHSQNLSVTIPQSVKAVESWAFNGSSGQIKILCKTPPTIEHQNAFSSSTAEIHVPYGCLESYADEPWYTFRKNGKLKEFVPNIQSGTCGENLTYSLDLDYGELTISGTGEIRSPTAWKEHKESIISVIIENGVTSIGQKAFSDYPNLISVQIPNSMVSIGVVAFEWCTSLANINIPNSVTTIGIRAFEGCSNLSNINIPNSVINIGQGAFYGCKSLTTIKIPNSVTSIAEGTFAECHKLASVDIPNSVISIGDGAFSHCRSLINVEMSDNLTSIGSQAFEFCGNLINLEIPNTVTSIGAWAFCYCTSLTNINIPNGITCINRDVFSGCKSITNIKIPNSVTSIGYQAFQGCSNLKKLEIPNSVTSIGDKALSGCSNLSCITCLNPFPPACEEFTFYNVLTSKCKLLVPIGSESAYSAANGWKEFSEILGIETEVDPNPETYSAFVINDTTVMAGSAFTMPVELKNSCEVTAFQCDIYLPEGITLQKNNKDKYEISLDENRKDDHTITIAEQPDGSIRIVVASLSSSTFSGTEGTLFNMGLLVADDTSGEKNIAIKNVYISEANGKRHDLADAEATVTIQTYTPADVNNDGMIAIDDVVLTINTVLGNVPENFVFDAADMNGDGRILIDDVVRIINVVLGIYAPPVSNVRRNDVNETFILNQKETGVGISVSNAAGYTAMQYDMYLPEGAEVSDVRFSGKSNHKVSFRKINKNVVRVIVVSLTNEVFSGNELLDVVIDTALDTEISIKDANVATRSGIKGNVQDASVNIGGNTTAIDQLLDGMARADVHDLNGRLVKKNAATITDLQKGIYIINGKRIIR